MTQIPENPSEALEMLQRMLAVPSNDPSRALPYPPGLALDIALESAPLPEILEAYNITPEQMKGIIGNPNFQRELENYRLEIQQDGYTFRMKAKAQAEEYLNIAWKMVHSPDVPSNVRADLIKQTVRWAALEAPPPASSPMNGAGGITPDMLASLRDIPDAELEMQVARIVLRRTGSERPLTGQILEGALIEDGKDGNSVA